MDNETAPLPTTLKPHEDKIALGIASGVTAFFLFAIMNACAKILMDTHNVFEIAFYRNFFALLPIAAYMLSLRRKELFRTDKPVALVFRVLIGATGLIVTFSAVKELPMADFTVILFASTLIVPVLSHFLLKEHIGPHRWAAIIVGMMGVLLIAHPSGEITMYGLIMALSAAFIQAVVQIFLRYLKSEPSITVTFYFTLGGMILPGLLMPFFAQAVTLQEWVLMIAMGLSGGAAQFFLTTAFRLAPASVVTPFNYTGLIWATGFDILIWHYVPGWPVFTGGAIIIASKLYILHREHMHEKKRRKKKI